ncbi:MAG: hypothetical protein H6739_33250 [Alphaproteobacteria bacterium]|nr:hypothetical protein [Alphaproteobacteria bacterium]
MRPLLLSLALAALGCAAGPQEDSAAPAAGVTLSEVVYRSRFVTEGLTPGEKGGWSVDTAAGYHVEVDRAWAVTWSLQLVACSVNQQAGGWSLLGSGVAWASHGDDSDPSILPAPVAEDLAAPAPSTLGSARFPAARYCEVHALLARSLTETLHLPETPDLFGTSLYVEGRWSVGGGAPVPFVVQTSLNYGALSDLDAAIVRGSGGHAAVTWTRDLSTWMDGVAFADLDEDALARALVANLVQQATVSVTLEEIAP